ncbi:MAG: rhomboid family intramembrane serine protease [Fidelibacterota bacterium]|nr:MAG: rhomboid family intramembrane serine protease [Candidatus Neomarinimicrobiota bacterium]
MFFPYKDDNPRILIPYVTYGLLVVNILIFAYQTFLLDPLAQYTMTLRYGMIPANFWGGETQTILQHNLDTLSRYYPQSAIASLGTVKFLPGIVTMFTSPFLHAGWMHILGNMLFLYVFADNVEGSMGHVRFALFYILTALAAGLLHAAVLPSNMEPVVGASGAISGVLGGYLVRYPRARIHVLVFIVFFITTTRLPAVVVLGLWFLYQTISGLVSLQVQMSGGIAWFEHIGGFIAGFSYMAISTRGRKFRFRDDGYF